MKAPQFLVVTLHTVILSLFYFIDQSSTQQIGRGCQMNDNKRSHGVQRLLTDCPAAIGNLRAGIDPTITARWNSMVLICCPYQKRISAIKCSEYSKVFIGMHARSVSPNYLQPRPTHDLGRVTTEAPKQLDFDPSTVVVGIIGGRDANLGEFPYMAAIGYGPNGSSGYKCGGTLISERFIVSAAHCATSANQPTTVLLEDIRLDQNVPVQRIVVGIKTIVVHPQRKLPEKYADIVLLELSQPIKISKTVYPACLPQPEDRLENLSIMTTAGWGYTEGFAGVGSDKLQAVNLTRISQNDCENIYNQKVNEKNLKYPKGILRSQFCAGDPLGTKDTCNGDSGGGITVKKHPQDFMTYIIGLTSFGSRDCSGGEPGVYTNVQSYLDWIEATVWPGL